MISVYKALLFRQYKNRMEKCMSDDCSDYIYDFNAETIQKMTDITADYQKRYDISSTPNFITKIILFFLLTIIILTQLFNFEVAAGFIHGTLLIDLVFNIYISDKCLAAFDFYNHVLRRYKEKQ